MDTVTRNDALIFPFFSPAPVAVTDTIKTSLRGSWFNADTTTLLSPQETVDLGL
jgi:hypothetical protein